VISFLFMVVLIVWATGVSAQPSANFYAAPETTSALHMHCDSM